MDIGLLVCCLGTRRRRRREGAQAQQRRGHDGASTGFLRGTCACCAARHRHSASTSASCAAQLKNMPTPRRWMHGVNRVFARPPSPPCDDALMTAPALEVGGEEERHDGPRVVDRELSRSEHVAAATTIQACFRRHLAYLLCQARRALRALRSLVKVQAFSRGSYVRKQVDATIRCMKVLVRLQVRVRARQLLDVSKHQ